MSLRLASCCSVVTEGRIRGRRARSSGSNRAERSARRISFYNREARAYEVQLVVGHQGVIRLFGSTRSPPALTLRSCTRATSSTTRTGSTRCCSRAPDERRPRAAGGVLRRRPPQGRRLSVRRALPRRPSRLWRRTPTSPLRQADTHEAALPKCAPCPSHRPRRTRDAPPGGRIPSRGARDRSGDARRTGSADSGPPESNAEQAEGARRAGCPCRGPSSVQLPGLAS